MSSYQKSNWLYNFLNDVQLTEFYDSFKNDLQVTELCHFEYVRTAHMQRIGLSGPAIARVKDALKRQRKAAGLFKCSRSRWLQGFNFGAPLLDVLKYGFSRDCSSLSASTINEPSHASKIALPRPLPTTNCNQDFLVTKNQSSIPSNCCLIAPDYIELQKGRIGSGSFGVVHRGDWLTPSGKKVPVAVKILRSQNKSQTDKLSPDHLTRILSEVVLMQAISHINLIRIYGVILNNPLAIVTELAPLGSLLARLRSCNVTYLPDSSSSSLPTTTTAFPVDALWDVGIQIARGMAHLASNQLVHRDLAARNVLVFPSLDTLANRRDAFPLVKVGDFGLLRTTASRVLAEASTNHELPIYDGDQNQKIPFAWSSMEAISRREFSQASDVWSWAVTLWELWTNGSEPWQGVASSESLLTKLRAGRRLPWPQRTCPRRLFQLMLACWRPQPGQRPTFAYLIDRLDKTRPSEVIAVQHFDEADRMDLEVGDHVIVIDGRPDYFWWRGQNKRTSEIASFPREIVRLKRELESQDISGPIVGSFVHAGHLGVDGGQAWGYLDRIDPNFLLGVVPHHADTLSSGRCSSGGAAESNVAWHPLTASASARCGAWSSVGGCKSYSSEIGETELVGENNNKDPVIDGYDKEGDDERRILDKEAPSGSIIATQTLPPPRSRFLNRGLDVSSEWASMYDLTSLTDQNHPSADRFKSYSLDKTAAFDPRDETTNQPLIDFYRTFNVQKVTAMGASITSTPIPSAPIYVSSTGVRDIHSTFSGQAASSCSNPYFQAAWNSWMAFSPTNFGAGLFQQTAPLYLPNSGRPETQILVGASPNPFLSTPISATTVDNAPPVEAETTNIYTPARSDKYTNPFLEEFSESELCSPLPPRTQTQPPSAILDVAEIDSVMKLMTDGCSQNEAIEALNCVLHSHQARAIFHLHTPPPETNVLSGSSKMRDWRVKTAYHLLLMRRLAALHLYSDLDACWVALEKADWSIERAVELFI